MSNVITAETCYEKLGFQFISVFVNGIKLDKVESISIADGWAQVATLDGNGDFIIKDDEFATHKVYGTVTWEPIHV